MAISFDFSTASRIIFGVGKINEIGEIVQSLGKKVYILSGLPMGQTLNKLLQRLDASGLDRQVDYVTDEPSIQTLAGSLHRMEFFDPDVVIGFGGGSAIDTAKTVAALITNPGDLIDYLEVIGRGKQISVPPVPMVAIPTTAGTGSEVTRNAVIGDSEKRVKVSLRSQLLFPKVALVDPELTLDLPPHITASTGMDALTQLIEPLTSNKANPLTDAICLEGLHRVVHSLHEAYLHGDNLDARQDMAYASLLGGIALTNAKLGVVHGFASVLGGMFSAPHGAVCARLLPFTVEVNIKALLDRNPSNGVLGKYLEIAKIVTGQADANLVDGVAWLRSLLDELMIRPLHEYGLRPADFHEIVQKTKTASSTQGNPILLNDHELFEILDRAF